MFQHTGKSFAKCFLSEAFGRSLSSISGFIWHKLFIRTVKILFLYPMNCLSRFPWQCSHLVIFSSKKVLCLLNLKKMLSFSCVCSLKMGLLKLLSLILTDRKQYFLIQWQNTLPISKYSVSQFPVKCPTEKCYFDSAKSSLKAYVHILYMLFKSSRPVVSC